MGIRILCALCAISIAALGACGDDGKSAEQYAEEQAKELMKKKKGTAEVVKVAVPIKGGKRIECTDLLTDMEAFGEVFPDQVTMDQLDSREQTKRQPGVNAICELIRAGEPPTPEEQKKMSEKTLRLGVLPGDPYCEVRVDCGRPEMDDYESKCRKMSQHSGNRDLGVFACVMMSQRAERDAYRFKLFEPDTGCYLDILGGPSVTGIEIPRGCAKVAMEQITEASIAKYRE